MKTQGCKKISPYFYLLLAMLLIVAPFFKALAAEDFSTSTISTSELTPKKKDWKVDATLSIPMRGFQVATNKKVPLTDEPVGSMSFTPPASLEGSVSLAYKTVGISYRHTLASEQIIGNTSDKGTNEEIRLSRFFDQDLIEFSRQNIRGLKPYDQKAVPVAGEPPRPGAAARMDISYTDYRLRWIGGVPFFSDRVNSLGNFYNAADIPKQTFSFDMLYSLEANRQLISANNPFIGTKAGEAFGGSAALREISSTGFGGGIGLGFTVPVEKKFYFSAGMLVGGSFNFAEATYLDHTEDVSGLGTFLNARISTQWLMGKELNHKLGIKLVVDSWMIPANDLNVSSADAALSITYGVLF